MPSVSKAQQRLFAAIHAAQNSGDYSKLSPYAKKMAKSMSKKDVADFAATKIKNLPDKVKEELEIQEMIDEVLNLNESESVLSLQNSFYRTTKQSIDNFVKELQIAPDYKKNKIQYDEIILKIYRLFNSFDSKLRIIIKPITKKRLNAIGGNESDGEESPEKGPNI